MTALYPLRFQPLFRRYLWGGRRLATCLQKPIGAGNDYAESWEIVDHGPDQSVVASGPLAGTTLAQLLAECGAEILGNSMPVREGGAAPTIGQPRFPLLLKYLDAHQTLSVQVHPNDAQAARLDPPDLGKTEAWVVLAADPGSLIYAGLKPGVNRSRVEIELTRGTLENCLHSFEPREGDCLFIPAGLVHALGAGLLVVEIQQSSDTTFRLFDWNRVGPDGKPRALHVEQALDTIDYAHGPGLPLAPRPTERAHVSRLVTCDKFVLDRWQFDGAEMLGGDGRFHIVTVLEGAVDVTGDPAGEPLPLGGSMLVPAACGPIAIRPRPKCLLLDVFLP
jgi:mannose-6-phosphate isomerase